MLVEIVTEKKKKPVVFPCLMLHAKTGLIVLFPIKGEGTVISSKGDYAIGYYGSNWTMDGFTEFEGSVKLSNDECLSED